MGLPLLADGVVHLRGVPHGRVGHDRRHPRRRRRGPRPASPAPVRAAGHALRRLALHQQLEGLHPYAHGLAFPPRPAAQLLVQRVAGAVPAEFRRAVLELALRAAPHRAQLLR